MASTKARLLKHDFPVHGNGNNHKQNNEDLDGAILSCEPFLTLSPLNIHLIGLQGRPRRVLS